MAVLFVYNNELSYLSNFALNRQLAMTRTMSIIFALCYIIVRSAWLFYCQGSSLVFLHAVRAERSSFRRMYCTLKWFNRPEARIIFNTKFLKSLLNVLLPLDMQSAPHPGSDSHTNFYHYWHFKLKHNYFQLIHSFLRQLFWNIYDPSICCYCTC
jgi:hypothetical protein